jgi:hypothetical protein
MALGDLVASLSADPGAPSLDAIKQRQLFAQQLMQEGSSTAPIKSPWQGAANLAKAIIGGYQSGQAERDQSDWTKAGSAAFAKALAPQASVAAPTNAGTATASTDAPDPSATEAYIRQRAPSFGIDPDKAVAVAKSEGLNAYAGDSGSSFGPFQLHYGGVAQGGNSVAGLGDDFTKATGLDARDPKTLNAQIDFALAHASQNGWGAFHGAGKSGIGEWDGIGKQPSVQVAGNSNAVPTASVGPITVPGYDGKFTRDQANDAEGVPSQAEWDAAAKAAGTGAVAASAPPQAAAAAPVAPKPAVDPQGARLLAAMADPHITPAQRQVLGLMYTNIKNQEQFGAPYKDQFGNVVQRNAQTGKIEVLNKAADGKELGPKVVGAQGALVDATGKELYKNKGSSDSATPDLVDSLATRAIAGDTTWKTGLARVPGLIQKVEEEVAQRGKKSTEGNNAGTILQNRANQVGRVQEQRTLGSATANNTLYGNAAASTIDTAIQASRDVPRSSWLPVNKILQGGEKAMSDPKLGAFVAATNTLVNDYAKATTPVGTPTDSQRHHAEDMLNTAQSPEVYEAVANMMRREIANTHGAIDLTKEQLRSGQPAHFPASNLPPAGPTVPGSQSQGVWDTIKGAFGGGKPAAPQSKAEFDAMPSGTHFIAPDGSHRIKP